MPGATQTDVFNLALTRLAVKPVSAPDENTVMATVMARIWDFCRRSALSQASWGFATVPGETLVLLSSYTPPGQWVYGYQYPVKALAVWKVYNPSVISDPLLIQDPTMDGVSPSILNLQSYLGNGEVFEKVLDPITNSQVILTNCQDALCAYTYDMTDTSQWSDNFIDGLSYLLAANGAMPLTGDPDIAKRMGDAAVAAFSEAKRFNKAEDNQEKFGDGSIVNSRA